MPYNLRHCNTYLIMSARTERCSHTYFAYCVREWDQLDSNIRTQPTVSSFERKLIEIIRPEKQSTFKASDSNGVKRLTRLRVKYSDLHEHKFKTTFMLLRCVCVVKTLKPLNITSYAARIMLTIVRSSSNDLSTFQESDLCSLFYMVTCISMKFQTVQFWNQLLNLLMTLVVSLATCDSPCESVVPVTL